MLSRRTLLTAAAATTLVAPLAAPAIAQTRLSDGPIRLVVPFPPGGPNDLVARVLAQKLGPILDRVVVIENRSGAGGVVGTDFVAKAPADGKTMALTSAGAIAISPALLPTMPFDNIKDLSPITLVALMPELLAVNKDMPFNDLAGLIDYAKKNPGKLNFASSGNGSMPHLAGESLRSAAAIDIVHVPYRGAAPAVTDLISGQVQMMFADMPALMSQVQAGSLKPIALAAKARSSLLPNTPTIAEAGHPTVEAENWYGLVVSAKTPEPIRALLHEAAVKALADADLKKAYAEQGAIPVGNSADEFGKFIAAETAKWGRIGKAAGVVMD